MVYKAHDKRLRNIYGSGFCYSDHSLPRDSSIPQHMNQMQSFELNSEQFNMESGNEMWRGCSLRTGGVDASTSKTLVAGESTGYYKPDFALSTAEALLVAPNSAWQQNRFFINDSWIPCIDPRVSHGLSLSLCGNKVSGDGFQSFELNSSDGLFDKSLDLHQHQHQQNYQPQLSSSQNFIPQQIKYSKYLTPAQELLNELCSVGTKAKDDNNSFNGSNKKTQKKSQLEEGVSSKINQSLNSLDFLELQKRKSKLVSLLEEMDRRYRQYCEQMRSVVSSFEAVAGSGAASVYSSLALKAMSRHFRCLKDGILGQIKATKKAMGDKDSASQSSTRGETPRLKLLDQQLRQQKALQQMSLMESHPWRPQRGLPERSVSILRAWLFEHFLHPYPTDVDKHILARQAGLSRSQVSNWFINARVRLWKPMVEEMYIEETKLEQDNNCSEETLHQVDSSRPNTQDSNQNPNPNLNPTKHENNRHPDEQKPVSHYIVHDFDSLSSIVKDSEKGDQRDVKGLQSSHTSQFPRDQNFGTVDLDFSNYSRATSTVMYGNGESSHSGFGGNGVSLTLGLQQHNVTGGVGLSFSPASQSSLFFSRQHMEECPPIEYSILDGETQNLQYRNLMGAQLLHDLA